MNSHRYVISTVTFLMWGLAALFIIWELPVIGYILLYGVSLFLWLILFKSMGPKPVNGSFIVNTTSPESEVYQLVLDEELPYLTNRKYIVLKVVHI